MSRTALLAAVAVVTAWFAAPAHAAPEPYGTLCGFVAVTDPQVDGSLTALVFGGPLVFADDTDLSTYSGALTCTIQVNTATHAGADACAVTYTVTTGTCTFAVGPPSEDVYLCTEVQIAGGPTLYYDDPNDVAGGDVRQGDWTTDPNSSCGHAWNTGDTGVACEPTAWPCNGILLIVCPLLAVVFPPYGDVSGLVDCAPYGDMVTTAPYVSFLLPGYHLPRRI